MAFHSNKCDTDINCNDKSDESNCDYLILPKTYAKELIPRGGKCRNMYTEFLRTQHKLCFRLINDGGKQISGEISSINHMCYSHLLSYKLVCLDRYMRS